MALDYTSVIQQLYVSYFGRPADAGGLMSFQAQLAAIDTAGAITSIDALNAAVNAGTSPALNALVNSFNTSAESVSLYGAIPATGATYTQLANFVNSIYENVLGRAADTSGGNFWINAIQTGSVTLADAALSITQGAMANTTAQGLIDAATVANKLATANDFTTSLTSSPTLTLAAAYSGNAAAAAGRAMLAGITSTTTVVAQQAAALALDTQLINGLTPTTFTLTTGVDTATASVFNGSGATFSALDNLTGTVGGTNNSLNIVDASGVMNTSLPSSVKLTNIQNMNVTTIGSLGKGASAGITAQAQQQTYLFSGTPAAATDTFIVNYGTLNTTVTTGAASTNVAAAVANALNSLAGKTIAAVSGSTVTVTAPVAGTALNTITFSGGTAADYTNTESTVQANVVGSAAVTAVVYDISGLSSVTAFTGSTVGGAGLNAASTQNVTLTDTASNSTTAVTGGKNVTVTESGTAGAVTVDGSAGIVTVNQNTVGAVTIGGTTAVTGAVVVTAAPSSAATGVIDVQGGTTVNVTASSTGAAGAITIGATTAAATTATTVPTGAVIVTENITGAKAANTAAGGNITVNGGTTVSVTETATQPFNTAPAAGASSTNYTTTQSNVVVNGSAATTAVTVNQAAAATATITTAVKAAVAEVDQVTFTGLVGTTGTPAAATFGGLTFTTTQTLTAAQVAAAFANLTAGATQGNSVLGTYSGTFASTATSGAVTTTATASTVNFTASTAGTATALGSSLPAATLVVTTANTAGVTAAAGTAGIVDGAVTIIDANYAGATANTITSATLNGYGTAAISSSALTSLSLANSAAAVTVNNKTATTLGLTVNNLGSGSTLSIDGGTVGTYKTLNITTATADSADDIVATGVTALTVSGTNALDLTSATAGHLGNADLALKTVVVSGSAGLTGNFSGAAVTDVNASATSGAITATIDASKATYEGGSGNDIVTVTSNVSHAISLGAGNNTFVLGTGAVTAAVNGGSGAADTLSIDASTAATDSGSTVFASFVTGFEHLTLTGGTAAATVNLSMLGGYNYVTDNATVSVTLENMASNGTLVFNDTAPHVATLQSTAAVTAVASLNVDALTTYSSVGAGSDTGTNATVTLAATGGAVFNSNITSVNLVSTDNGMSAGLSASNSVTLTDNGNTVTSITVSGNGAINLLAHDTALTTVNASANTGGLSFATTGSVAETITGSATAANTLLAAAGNTADTLIGGAGNDTITSNSGLDTLTGGGGNDTFVINVPANVNTYATITDAHVGDLIKLSGITAFSQTQITLASTAVFQDYANAAVHSIAQATGNAAWFEFGGNTYVVENNNATATATSPESSFVNGTDSIVKLTGIVDLSHTSVSTTAHTLLIG